MVARGARIAHGAALLACALLLTGCSAGSRPAPSASAAAGLPTSWPSVRGRVLAESSPPDERLRRIAVRDSEAAYAEARRLLVAAGYTLTKDRAGTGGGDGQACTARLCVDFTATDASDWGPNVAYEVFRPQGIAP